MRTANRRNTWTIAATVVLLTTASGRAAALCVGDCNTNDEVTINELVTGVTIILGGRSVDACLAADPNVDRTITINEVIQAVNSLLQGCVTAGTPGSTGTVTTTAATATATRTGPTATTTATATGPTSTVNPAGTPTATHTGPTATATATATGPTSTVDPAGTPTPTRTGLPGASTATATATGPTSTVNPLGSRTPTASPINTYPVTPYEPLPRVVGAVSTSNLTVVVHFSEPMSDSALDLSHYFVELQPNVGVLTLVSRCVAGEHFGHLCGSPGFVLKVCDGDSPHPGRLCRSDTDCGMGTCETGCEESDCQGTRFLDNRTQVELQTLSQNDGIYTITAAGVTDVDGYPLAPKHVVAGAVIDPTSATFPGTGPFTNGMIDGNAGVDSDGDGMPDTDEQAGWDVTVTLLNGQLATQHLTANPLFPDTDGEGLVDPTEFAIGSNPRSNDTDGEGLTDAEEYNVVYSDPTKQDTDDDGIADNLEVETFKTNAILADSDGDGYSDSEELFEMNRDPRIADVPETRISVASEQLRIDERFTYTDENGDTQSESSSTSTSMQNVRETFHASHGESTYTAGFSIAGGLENCQSDCKEETGTPPVPTFGARSLLYRLRLVGEVGFEYSTLNSTDDSTTTQAINAFDRSVEKGKEITTSHSVTREVVGAQFDAEVTLQNPSDVAFSLSNVEITVQTADPQNPSRLVPVATLLPTSESGGDAAVFNIGPNGARGPVVFSNREIFPNLVEDLMRAPRAFVYTVANYDVATEDGRNFAFGLQAVRDRTAQIAINFGDGELRSERVITAGVLNRPREQGGTIVGGFEGFAGTGRPRGIPLDFALQDLLQMRKSHPAVIVAGPDLTSNSTAAGDDIALPLPAEPTDHTPVIAPGRNGVLNTVPTGDDAIAAEIVAGANGIVNTRAQGDDVQLLPVGTRELAADTAVVDPGANGLLDTSPGGDDLFHAAPADGIREGGDRVVHTIAQGDDVQLVPAGTEGVPGDTLIIAAGENGVLDTAPAGDDVADVVTGYEVSRTCNGNAIPYILTGPNGKVDTQGGPGVCVDSGDACQQDDDCDDKYCFHLICSAGDPAKAGSLCHKHSECEGTDPDTKQFLEGYCDGDDFIAPDDYEGGPFDTVAEPGPNGFMDSVPLGDDIYTGPGIPCVVDDECNAGACTGPEQVVRVERRRRGQFRRQWVLLMPDDTQLQTDFGQIRLRPGQTLGLAFIQDIDRDGLISSVEALHKSSDFKKDTDDDRMDDFAEIRVGWDVGVVGQSIRHVFSDPSRADSDGDGLSDFEESDLRDLGVDTYEYDPEAPFSTDPRLRDTDADGVGDKPEVFGYLTGAGIVNANPAVIIAGVDKDADTEACPLSQCTNEPCSRDAECLSGVCFKIGMAAMGFCHCSNDGDCLDHRSCQQQAGCDDVQVLPRGTRVLVASTVVVAAGSDDVLQTSSVMGDARVSTSSSVARTAARGDDVPVVEVGQDVTSGGECVDQSKFPMCAVVKPGPDGEFSSTVGGNEVLAFGQLLERTNPVNADTDFDEVQDGIEQRLGSSPGDPADTGVFSDRDADGLTDNQEAGLAWPVTVFLGAGICSGSSPPVPCYRASDCGLSRACQFVVKMPRPSFSNPNVADTDGDGLPDYAERHLPCFAPPTCDGGTCSNNSFTCNANDTCVSECPTDPTTDDTDGDGLSDYDELSADQLTDLERLNDFFTGFRLDDSTSEKYGTDPTRVDTDGDGLSDGFELLVGWSVRLAGSGGAQHVLSNPTLYDTDADGLSDFAECKFDPMVPVAVQCTGLPASSGPTNPTDPDTDGDDKLDGEECSETSCETDPLIAQASLEVSVSFTSIRVGALPTPHAAGSDFVFEFNVQKPHQPYPGEPVLTQLTPNVVGRNIGDRLFTSADCVSGGAKPGSESVLSTRRCVGGTNYGALCTTAGNECLGGGVCPADTNATTGVFACNISPGRELVLTHSTRCAEQSKRYCPNYLPVLTGASDVCGVLNSHNCSELCTTGTFPNVAFGSCVDDRAERAVSFPLRTNQGFVLNGFLNGLASGNAAHCQGAVGLGSLTCAQDSDCANRCSLSAGPCSQSSPCPTGQGCISGVCDARSAQSTYCEMTFAKDYNFQSLRPGFSIETFDLVSPDGTCSAKVSAEITVR